MNDLGKLKMMDMLPLKLGFCYGLRILPNTFNISLLSVLIFCNHGN